LRVRNGNGQNLTESVLYGLPKAGSKRGRLTTQGLVDKDTLFDFNELAFAPIEAPY
jgi:hypothetical protein